MTPSQASHSFPPMETVMCIQENTRVMTVDTQYCATTHPLKLALVKAQAEMVRRPGGLTLSDDEAAGVRTAPNAQAAQQGVDALGEL